MPYVVTGPSNNNTPPKSLFYGDSITCDAKSLLKSYHASVKGTPLDVVCSPLASPCDMLPDIRARLRDDIPPRILALEFYGYNRTRCVGAPTDGGVGYGVLTAQFQDAYEKSFDRIKRSADWVGTPVFWVTPPPHPASDPNPDLNTTIAGWAASRGWTIIDAGAAVANGSGDWVEFLPCQVTESTLQGCVGGQVKVRNADLINFQFVSPGGYSGGAMRWASAAIPDLPVFSATPTDCYPWPCLSGGVG